MANVTVTCRNFTAQYAATNGVRSRDVSKRAVLRAVTTVGAQKFLDVFSLGWRGFLHRFGMGLSALSFLEQSPAGLCLSDRFSSLDSSEKGVTSYWYGMALAKIIADIELDVPWLAHVDQMRKSGALTTPPGSNERGDLVGRGTNGDWHVVEAKGRSNSYPASLVAKAKSQSARVISINGQPPATTSACITSLFTHPISVLFDDPPPDYKENGEGWRINENDFFRQYYRGIMEYLSEFGSLQEQTIGNTVFVTAPLFPFLWDFFHFPAPRPFPGWRLELGLLASIYKTPERAPRAVKDLPHDDEDKVGSDGIAIFGPLPHREAT